ncbi:hypothetical protein D9758_010667 [Tetrapyrgos nigripes]|uniref:F-box domain-containing protein n=1 Tax=Tetrapyrgos nigripes TaxID=182062 RepID=A0A8H5GGA4_9AGAR|nr:hypothetical protein D9758_010667 [Tetrapyrgos nigripes]
MSVPILYIAGTCVFWRKVALKQPRLWADITIRFDGLYDPWDRRGRANDILHIWLKRSESSPLKLRVHLWGPVLEPDIVLLSISDLHFTMGQILDDLFMYSSRWKSASLSLDVPMLTHVSEDIWEREYSFPVLENLIIAVDPYNQEAESWAQSFSGIFATAPLRQIAVPDPDHWPGMLFNLIGITSVTLDVLYDVALYNIVHLPVLRVLRYKGSSHDGPILGLPQILLENLSHLDICASSSSAPDRWRGT